MTSLGSKVSGLTFSLGDTAFPRGGHLQGIQMRFDAANKRHLAFLSHDSETVGYLVIVEFPADLSHEGRVIHVHHFPSDGQPPPLRHAGGIQLAGDVLVVGLEDNQQRTRSEVQFWNVSVPRKPAQLAHLTVRRSGVPKHKTAGAVGLVKREKDYLLAVANWDSRAIDFYLSNARPLDDPDCRFELLTHWRDDGADKGQWRPEGEFASYQAIHLASDASGQIFLAGFATSANRDVVDLFAVDLDGQPAALLRKLARKPVELAGGNHFVYSGGLWANEGRLAILASPRNLVRPARIAIVK